MAYTLQHTAESIDHKLSLIDENKNLLTYPYVTSTVSVGYTALEDVADILEDVGDGSILVKKQPGEEYGDIEVLLVADANSPLTAGKKYVVSLNITDILENTTILSGCELIVRVDNSEKVRTTNIIELDLAGEDENKAILVFLKVPASAEKGLLIKPQIEEYKENEIMGVWSPNMDYIGTYVDRRFNGTNTKIKVLADRIRALNELVSVLSGTLGLPDCTGYPDNSILVVKNGAWEILPLDELISNPPIEPEPEPEPKPEPEAPEPDEPSEPELPKGLIYEYDSTEQAFRVTGIEEGADRNVIIPSTYSDLNLPVIGINNYAFQDCDLISVEIPDTVTTIGDFAFADNPNLTNIIIPNNVKYIGTRAFLRCGLTNVNIPASVTTIQDAVFESCTKLTHFTVDADNRNFQVEDGVLFTVPSTGDRALIQYPIGNDRETYNIPDDVTVINPYAFYESNLTNIYLPSTDTVNTIGEYAFGNCKGLTVIGLRDGIRFIGSTAFSGCENLSTINCEFHEGYIQDTPWGAPENVTIKYNVDLDTECLTFTNVRGDEGYSSDGYIVKGINKNCNHSTIVIPETYNNMPVIGIENNAFQGCDITSIIIPSTVKTIGQAAFSNCTKLRDITISEGVREIGAYAFSGCELLQTVYIPESVVSMGELVFDNCPRLITVSCGFERDSTAAVYKPWGATGTVNIYFGDDYDVS